MHAHWKLRTSRGQERGSNRRGAGEVEGFGFKMNCVFRRLRWGI
jgi:hypothetical protein